ncbi:MAG: hypothetical protein SGBAC_007048 [Bacillariaceae sp.]
MSADARLENPNYKTFVPQICGIVRVAHCQMYLSSHARSSPKARTPLPERYKQDNEFLRTEIRKVKIAYVKQLAEKDALINDLNGRIQRLQQQQQQHAALTRTMSNSASSSSRSTNTNTRSGTLSASTISTSSLQMAELASFSSSFSEDESISSHNILHQSFLSMPPVPLTEGDEEEEEERDDDDDNDEEEDIVSQEKEDETDVKETVELDSANPPEDNAEEVVSDELPRRNHSLSTLVRATSKKFVRRMSKKAFFRRKLGRKGTPLPTTMEIVGDFSKKDLEVEIEEEEEEEEAQASDPRDIHCDPESLLYNCDEKSLKEPPRLDSFKRMDSLLKRSDSLKRKASIHSTSSSAWSIDPIPSDSAIQFESSERSSAKSPPTKPRRHTICSTTPRVRELPRELSLNRVVTEDEETDNDDDDDHDLPNPQMPAKQRYPPGATIDVNCQHIADACKRRGLYKGNLDANTRLPHGHGSMIYPDRAQYMGSWEQGHWQGKATFRDGKGSVYHGYFEQDKKEGTGILKYASGKTFEGRFRDDQMYEGTMTDARTGSMHEGLFENGKSHGFGSHQYMDGTEYRGQFEQGERHGHGTVIMSCGAYYTGDFENDVAHGIGQAVNVDGTVEHTGQWDAGQPVPQIFDA